MPLLTAFVAGLVFGLGLVIAGMANPAKILNFLDLAGNWDPSLLFVMLGAIAVGMIAFAAARRRATTALGLPMQLPTGASDRRAASLEEACCSESAGGSRVSVPDRQSSRSVRVTRRRACSLPRCSSAWRWSIFSNAAGRGGDLIPEGAQRPCAR
jgi:uncharacterized membrane protein YedE/YeeE